MGYYALVHLHCWTLIKHPFWRSPPFSEPPIELVLAPFLTIINPYSPSIVKKTIHQGYWQPFEIHIRRTIPLLISIVEKPTIVQKISHPFLAFPSMASETPKSTERREVPRPAAQLGFEIDQVRIPVTSQLKVPSDRWWLADFLRRFGWISSWTLVFVLWVVLGWIDWMIGFAGWQLISHLRSWLYGQ